MSEPAVILPLMLVLALASLVYRLTHRKSQDSARRIAKEMFTGAIVFLLLGPPVGAAVLSVLMFVITFEPTALMFMIAGLFYGYIFGGIPALCTGLVAGALKPEAATRKRLAFIMLAGACFSLMFQWDPERVDGSLNMFAFLLIWFVIPGALSSLLCGVLFHGQPEPRKPKAPAEPAA